MTNANCALANGALANSALANSALCAAFILWFTGLSRESQLYLADMVGGLTIPQLYAQFVAELEVANV